MVKINPPFVRSPYNYDVMAASDQAAVAPVGESMCQQHFAEESDINTIVRRFGLTGELPSGLRAPEYGDFTGVTDYKSALEAVIAADEAFMQMPAEVRARFQNDAGLFVDFCSDEANREELGKLGLLKDVPVASKEVPAPPAPAAA